MASQPANPAQRDHKALTRKIMIDLTIMTAIGVILALIGPFGSFAEPLDYRLLSWVSFSWVGYALFTPMGPVVDRVSTSLDLPRAPLWLVASAISSVPMTLAVYTMQSLPGPIAMPSAAQFLSSYPYVFVIGGGVTALFYLLAQREEASAKAASASALSQGSSPGESQMSEPSQEPEPLAEVTVSISNPLLDALPAELGSDILALEMEDHYVRVHTALGSELVLMRLRDAMVHVADIDGRQTHRSWWVARGAVEDVTREGRNVRLVLARGIEAPVSRAQVSELKDAGWI